MTASWPKITIVTVVFNDKNTIEQTINSVLNQSYPNIEYIVIDGGSDDGTQNIITSYQDKLAHYSSEPDNGIYDAMNKGIRQASGAWINFMNAGDEFYNNDVIKDIFPLDGDVDLVYGKNQCIYTYFDRVNVPEPFNRLKYGMIFSHQSMFVKTALMKSEPFDLNFKISADYNFIYHLHKNGGIFKEVDVIISKVKAEGYSEVNLIHTHTERKRTALSYETGFSKLLLGFRYNLVSLKILFIKYVKRILPRSVVQKITMLKHR